MNRTCISFRTCKITEGDVAKVNILLDISKLERFCYAGNGRAADSPLRRQSGGAGQAPGVVPQPDEAARRLLHQTPYSDAHRRVAEAGRGAGRHLRRLLRRQQSEAAHVLTGVAAVFHERVIRAATGRSERAGAPSADWGGEKTQLTYL